MLLHQFIAEVAVAGASILPELFQHRRAVVLVHADLDITDLENEKCTHSSSMYRRWAPTAANTI